MEIVKLGRKVEYVYTILRPGSRQCQGVSRCDLVEDTRKQEDDTRPRYLSVLDDGVQRPETSPSPCSIGE